MIFFFFSSLVFLFFSLQKRIPERYSKYEMVQASLQNKKKRLFPSKCLIWRAAFLHRNPWKQVRRLKSEKAQVALALEQKHGMWWKQKALLLCWGHESALSGKANPGCILIETGCPCPDMFCVWLPLFITLNTSSGLRRPNSITATDARSYSQWFTICLYFVPPGCTPLPTMLPFRKRPCHVVNSV